MIARFIIPILLYKYLRIERQSNIFRPLIYGESNGILIEKRYKQWIDENITNWELNERFGGYL